MLCLEVATQLHYQSLFLYQKNTFTIHILTRKNWLSSHTIANILTRPFWGSPNANDLIHYMYNKKKFAN